MILDWLYAKSDLYKIHLNIIKLNNELLEKHKVMNDLLKLEVKVLKLTLHQEEPNE